MLADLLREAGDTTAAIAHYQKAVATKPDLAPANHNLAALLLDAGRANEAVDAVCRALLAQDSEASRALFVQCVRGATALPGEPEFRALTTRALSEVWGRPVELAPAALTLVSTGGPIGAAIQAIDGVWPRRVHPSVLAPCMNILMQDPLLHRVMESPRCATRGWSACSRAPAPCCSTRRSIRRAISRPRCCRSPARSRASASSTSTSSTCRTSSATAWWRCAAS